MFSAVSTASHMIGKWQKHELSFRATWPLALFVALEDFVLIAVIENNVMSCLVSKLRELSVWQKNPFLSCKLHDILMPVHIESDSCNFSGEGILCEEYYVFCCEGKLVTTFFHLMTEKKKKIKKPVGICLKS